MALEDLNGWIGDTVRAGLSGTFGISGENNNGRRLVEFCAERGLCVVTCTLNTRVFISTKAWQRAKME